MREQWFLRKQYRPNLWVRGIFLILIICAFTIPALAAPPTPAAPGDKVASLDQQALEAALNKALDRQLAPIKEMLTELTIHQTTLPDILGGIGYILGFFGLWAYFQSRRKKDS
jgi:hypothetical protein